MTQSGEADVKINPNRCTIQLCGMPKRQKKPLVHKVADVKLTNQSRKVNIVAAMSEMCEAPKQQLLATSRITTTSRGYNHLFSCRRIHEQLYRNYTRKSKSIFMCNRKAMLGIARKYRKRSQKSARMFQGFTKCFGLQNKYIWRGAFLCI